jgi:hypothetical protein
MFLSGRGGISDSTTLALVIQKHAPYLVSLPDGAEGTHSS